MGFLDFLFGIGSILSSIASFISSLFLFLWNALQIFFIFLWNVISSVINFFGSLGVIVGRFFRNIWTAYLKPFFKWAVEKYRALREWLNKVVGPVLRWIRRIREILDRWYLRIFGPILQTIQRVRAILGIFRIFGLEFARKLDEKLAGLEARLVKPFLAIRDILTQVTGVLNLVLDPGLLFRRSVIGGSILKSIGTIWRLLGWGRDLPLSIADEKRQKQDRERFDLSKPESIAVRAASPEFQEYSAKLRAELRREYLEATGREMTPQAR